MTNLARLNLFEVRRPGPLPPWNLYVALAGAPRIAGVTLVKLARSSFYALPNSVQ